MNKEDIEMIEHAQALMKYCEKHEMCKDCIFQQGVCVISDIDGLPEDWTFSALDGE